MARFGRFATTITIGALLALAATTGAQQEDEASVTFEDQTTDGNWVEVANATLPDGGFVVIRNDTDDGILPDLDDDEESFLGNSEYLEPGSHLNITIFLNETQEGEMTLTAVIYQDSDGNETFDQDEDEAYTSDGEDVSSTATVTFEEEVADPGDSPAAGDDDDEEQTPAPGILSVVVLGSLALLAARRR